MQIASLVVESLARDQGLNCIGFGHKFDIATNFTHPDVRLTRVENLLDQGFIVHASLGSVKNGNFLTIELKFDAVNVHR